MGAVEVPPPTTRSTTKDGALAESTATTDTTTNPNSPSTHLSPDKAAESKESKGEVEATREKSENVEEKPARQEAGERGLEGSGNESIQRSGKCKWFDSRRGFGFITEHSDVGGDVFVHQQCILAKGFRSLHTSEEVRFQVQTDEQGRKKAVNVTGPNGQPVVGEAPGAFFYRGGGGGGGYGGEGGRWNSRGGYNRRGGGMWGGQQRGGRGQYKMGNGGGLYPYKMPGAPEFIGARFVPHGCGVRGYFPNEYAMGLPPNGYGYIPAHSDYPPYPFYQ
eukprot:GHVN01017771.1.p1 GENE.GHVN01017771.1~~GHVN01017771.1.p1  ORF type:complete len:277 (+),score=59.06 GHVN01017771.1:245-1075(+)